MESRKFESNEVRANFVLSVRDTQCGGVENLWVDFWLTFDSEIKQKS